jgi:transposase
MAKTLEAKDLTREVKAIILRMRVNGLTQVEIAGHIGISQSCISKFLKRHQLCGLTGKKVLSGRKRKISIDLTRKIIEIVKGNRRLSAPKLVALLEYEDNLIVSPSTVKRVIHRHGFRACSPRKVPFISPESKKKRLAWAKAMIVKPKEYWRRVIWTDESKFNLFSSDGKLWVWRAVGEAFDEKCTSKTVKHGGGNVMVWGCMSAVGTGNLALIDGKMYAPKYIKLLQNNLVSSARKLNLDEWVFQQDNDPKHTSKLSMSYFEANDIEVMDWPAQSPDLNVIEHV